MMTVIIINVYNQMAMTEKEDFLAVYGEAWQHLDDAVDHCHNFSEERVARTVPPRSPSWSRSCIVLACVAVLSVAGVGIGTAKPDPVSVGVVQCRQQDAPLLAASVGSLQPAVRSPQPTVRSSQSAARSSQFTAHSSQSVARSSQFTAHSSQFTDVASLEADDAELPTFQRAEEVQCNANLCDASRYLDMVDVLLNRHVT